MFTRPNVSFALGVALGLIGLIAIGSCNAKADPLVDQVRAPVVRLDAYCSGTIISSKRDDKTGKVATYVLTAKHCVKDDDKSMVPIAKDQYDGIKKNGKSISDGDVFGQSYKSDLALVKLRDEKDLFENVAEVASRDINLQYGQAVIVEGFPLGLGQTETEGKLGYLEQQDAFNDISQSRMFYRATPDTAPGSSGSGMFTFDNGKYKLIGVLTGGYPRASYINYYTPVTEINDYLETALSDVFKKKDDKTVEKSTAPAVATVKVYQ